jgi:hypothetical protein
VNLYPIQSARLFVRIMLFFVPTKKVVQKFTNGNRRVLYVKRLLSRMYVTKTMVYLKSRPNFPMTADELNTFATITGRVERREFLRIMKRKYGKRVS